MATGHLIHGFVGVGKTTFSKQLEQDLSAVRFTTDEWLTKLYGSNPPAEYFRQYEERIVDIIWDLALQLVRRGVDIILDFGFWTRESRDQARARFNQVDADFVLYHITCSDDEIRTRVLKRTAELPAGALYIDEAAIELFRSRFQPLAPNEKHITIDTSAKPAG